MPITSTATAVKSFASPTLTSAQASLNASASAATPSSSGSPSSTKVTNFVDNMWVAGARDDLLAKDVYSGPTSGAISSAAPKPTSLDFLKEGFSFRNTLSATLKGAATNIRSIANMAKTVNSAVKAANDLQKAVRSGNITNLAERALGTNKALTNAFAAAGITLDPKVISGLSQATSIVAKVGTGYGALKSTNFKDINSIGGLLKTYTGDNAIFELKDVGADVAKACTVVNACVKNGIPNSVPTVLGLLGPDGPIKSFVAGALDGVLRAGDIKALNDLNKAVNDGFIKKLAPNVAADIANFFSAPFYSTTKEKTDTYKATIQTLADLDPSSLVGSFNGEPTINLVPIMRGNSQFKELVAHGAMNASDTHYTPDDRLLAFGTIFTSTSVLAELARQFPRTVLNSNSNTASGVINPLFL